MRSLSARQRTIRIADFDLPRGVISIESLMAMPRESWEHLRSEINLRRRLEPDRPLARCRLCEGGVFIRAQSVENGHVPLYAHFPESPVSCPWYEGGTIKPDDARAAQYQGHQELALHRHLCQLIEMLAKMDTRCRHSAIDTYLRPDIHKRGRWPDVFLDMGSSDGSPWKYKSQSPLRPRLSPGISIMNGKA